MATICQRLLLFLFLLSGGFAHAAWEEIEQFEDGMRVYVLRESLRRDGDISYHENQTVESAAALIQDLRNRKEAA